MFYIRVEEENNDDKNSGEDAVITREIVGAMMTIGSRNIHDCIEETPLWRTGDDSKGVENKVPTISQSPLGSLFHLPYEKLNVKHNIEADRNVAVPFVYALLSALPRARKNGA